MGFVPLVLPLMILKWKHRILKMLSSGQSITVEYVCRFLQCTFSPKPSTATRSKSSKAHTKSTRSVVYVIFWSFLDQVRVRNWKIYHLYGTLRVHQRQFALGGIRASAIAISFFFFVTKVGCANCRSTEKPDT